MAQNSKKCGVAQVDSPMFETLEDRLLLSAVDLSAFQGDSPPDYLPMSYFVYTNSANRVVAVSIWNDGNADNPLGVLGMYRLDPSDPESPKLADVPGRFYADWTKTTNDDYVDVAGGLAGPQFRLDTIIGNSGVPNIQALAYDAAHDIHWGYDNAAHQLFNFQSGVTALVQDVAPGTGVASGLTYTIAGMCFVPAGSTLKDSQGNSLDGKILAIGTLVAGSSNTLPAVTGPFLIVINPVTGNAYPTSGNYTTVLTGGPLDLDTDGTSIYGINATNIITIRTNGTSTVGSFATDSTQGNAPFGGMTGIAYSADGPGTGIWYVVSGGRVFRTNLISSGSFVPLDGTLNTTDLAGDPIGPITDLSGSVGTSADNPGRLFGIHSNDDGTQLVEIVRVPPLPCDIFMLYIDQADIHTHMSFWFPTVEGSGADFVIHFDQATIWGGTVAALTFDSDGNVEEAAAGGSGGINIGMVPHPTESNPRQTVAVTTTGYYPGLEDTAPMNGGLWPGGPAHAGIMSSGSDVGGGNDAVASRPVADIGQFLLPGTLAGTGEFSRDLSQFYIGFLWGDVDVAGDMGDMIVKTNVGWDTVTTELYGVPDENIIRVKGASRLIEVHGGFFGNVDIGGTQNTPAPDDTMADLNAMPIQELEVHPNPNIDALITDREWAQGSLNDLNNDTIKSAQFVYSETGNFTVNGVIQGTDVYADTVDYYALSLMAGKTITITSPVPANVTMSLLDSNLNVVATFDFNNPLTFQAPVDDIYYMVVSDLNFNPYSFTVHNSEPVSLGALRVWGNMHTTTDRPAEAEGNTILVRNGKTGAIVVDGFMYGELIQSSGDLVAIQCPLIGADATNLHDTTRIISQNSIGLIKASSLSAISIVAGSDWGFYNHNASIGRILVTTDIYINPLSTLADAYTSPLNPTKPIQGIWASGDIGIISVGRDLGAQDDAPMGAVEVTRYAGYPITADGDDVAPEGVRNQVDLIDVGRDFWAVLFRGQHADYKYVNVDGNIWIAPMVISGLWTELTGQTILDGGVTIHDDGGGEMKISPQQRLDANGNVVTAVTTVGGFPTPVLSTVTYVALPTYDLNATEGEGQVLARVDSNGPVNFTLIKPGDEVQMGQLAMTGNGDVKMSGTGAISVYYANATGIRSFQNTTMGDLVSGAFLLDQAPAVAPRTFTLPVFRGIKVGGDMGMILGTLGEMLPGHDTAATPAGYGNIRGITLKSDVDSILVNGHIGDIFGQDPQAFGIRTLRADADRNSLDLTQAIYGIVWVSALGEVNVGDGLFEMMPAYGRAAIGAFTIDKIIVDGLNKNLGGSIGATTERFDAAGKQLPSIGQIIARNGSFITGKISGSDPASFDATTGITMVTGGIGSISITDQGSQMVGAQVFALYLNSLTAGAETDGINGNNLLLEGQNAQRMTLGTMASGAGMVSNMLHVVDGDIGSIKATNGSDLIGNNFTADNGDMNEISADTFTSNQISVSGHIKKFAATTDVIGNVYVRAGTIDSLTVGGLFQGNDFRVTGTLGTMKVGGNFLDSTVEAFGPTTTRIGTITVTGNITGLISSDGTIGTITSQKGMIAADITAKGNMDKLVTAGGFTGTLTVGGNMGSIASSSTLGADTSTLADYIPRRMNIAGNLGSLTIKAPKGAVANMYTTLNVGGNVGAVTVAGNLYSDLFINGDMKSLSINGDMGGDFDLDPVGSTLTTLGNVEVLGSLGKLSLPSGASIIGDLTTSGSIGAIALKGGDVSGDITSLHGSIAGISLTDGDLSGKVTAARDIGTITLKGSSAPVFITQAITAQGGSVKSISLTNGSLQGDVSAQAGNIGAITLKGGDVSSASITASGRLGKLAVTGGDWGADLSGVALDSLTVTGGDLTGNVDVDGSANKISIGGTVDHSDVWVGGQLSSFTANKLDHATVAALTGLPNVAITGDVLSSGIYGGYNPAAAGGDPRKLHSADVGKVNVGGNWDSSVLAAGVNPVDGDFFTAGNTAIPGVSRIGTLAIKGSITGTNLVTADTSVGVIPAAMPLDVVQGTPPDTTGSVPVIQGDNTFDDGVTISFKGDGQAFYNKTTGQVIVENTDSKSSLAITSTAAKVVSIVGGDDAGLSKLSVSGSAQLGSVDIDGVVAAFDVAQTQTTTTWNLPGGVNKLTTGPLSSVQINAGSLGTFTVNGDIAGAGGRISADRLASMVIKGRMAIPLTAMNGGIGSLTATGLISGKVTSRETIGSLTAPSISGAVTVQVGDLTKLNITGPGDLSSGVDVMNGYIGSVSIKNGSFSSVTSAGSTAIRSLMGIGSFSISGGNSYGLISTNGMLNKISVTGKPAASGTGNATTGVMQSRVLARGGIGTIGVDQMQAALISTPGSIGSVTIKGGMKDSDIVAGLDVGDAGYDAANGGEDANLVFDGRTRPDLTPVEDTFGGGNIGSVKIGTSMSGSSIAAGISPGVDGWFGTADDQTRGTGSIGKVTVGTYIEGSGVSSQHYSITAASSLPKVTYKQYNASNMSIYGIPTVGGSPRVMGVDVRPGSVTIHFDHNVDKSTLTTDTVKITINGTNVTDTEETSYVFDMTQHTLTITLTGQTGPNTWLSLNEGSVLTLWMDGSVVADQRGNLLDGEFSHEYPSGDGQAGGDFKSSFIIGDAGDDIFSSPINLTQPGLLDYNSSFQLDGVLSTTSDVDVYKINLKAGDILYMNCSSPLLVMDPVLDEGWLVTSATGQGYLATTDGTVMLTLGPGFSSELGPYHMDFFLLNDHNSDFTLVDPNDPTTASHQTPTPVTWVGNVAYPPANAESIVAPDDVDVYNLGHLAGGQQLNLALDSALVGSNLHPNMAVFNSHGDLIGNVYSTGDTNRTDVLPLEKSLTISGTVYLPADDTYYVAVQTGELASGLTYGPTGFESWDTGKYRLSIAKSPAAAPEFEPQVVYVNFTGGFANWLVGQGIDPMITGMAATQFGFSPAEYQSLINGVMDRLTGLYSQFSNISFTTVRPTDGEYSTLYMSGETSPAISGGVLMGLAEGIDTNNQNHSDSAAVWGGSFATVFAGDTLDEMAVELGNTAGHELGHILGLNHTNGSADNPSNDIMSYQDVNPDQLAFQDHTHLMFDSIFEFLIGYQNYTLSLASIA